MVDFEAGEAAASASIIVGVALIAVSLGAVPATVASVSNSQEISVNSNFENPLTGATTFSFADTGQDAEWTVSISNNGESEWLEARSTLAMGTPNTTGTETVEGKEVFTCYSESAGQELSNSPLCKEDIVNKWGLQYRLPSDDKWKTPAGTKDAYVAVPEGVGQGESFDIKFRITVPEDWDERQRIILGNVEGVKKNGEVVQTSFTEQINPSPEQQASSGRFTGQTLQLGAGTLLVFLGAGYFLTREL